MTKKRNFLQGLLTLIILTTTSLARASDAPPSELCRALDKITDSSAAMESSFNQGRPYQHLYSDFWQGYFVLYRETLEAKKLGKTDDLLDRVLSCEDDQAAKNALYSEESKAAVKSEMNVAIESFVKDLETTHRNPKLRTKLGFGTAFSGFIAAFAGLKSGMGMSGLISSLVHEKYSLPLFLVGGAVAIVAMVYTEVQLPSDDTLRMTPNFILNRIYSIRDKKAALSIDQQAKDLADATVRAHVKALIKLKS